ncbi:MAG: LCP family protein [Coriobacteriia bacterium]|nr:LCP family protein [Coriobacteriia bacterium]
MGKHSHNHGGGLFGRRSSSVPGGKPVRRRKPTTVSGARVPADVSRRTALLGDRKKLSDAASRRHGPLESAPARLRAESDRRRQRAKTIAAVIAGSVVVLLVLGAGGVFAFAKHIERTMQRTVLQEEKLDLDLKKAAPQEPFTMLILGYDRRPPETVYRSDTVILAKLDPKTKQMWVLSIPRDTRVEIPGHGTRKINDAFALGGEELAVETVERFTGVKVNHYMGVNFKGFERAVDAMGGVWVDVPNEIDDIKADRSPGHRAAHIDAGYQLLDGEHALTFVRTRDYLDADVSRMKNQQTFFKAVADQVAKRTSPTKLPGIVSKVAPFISTDMSLMEMLRTASALRDAGSQRVYTATIGGEWSSPYIVTDEENKETLLAKFGAGEPFEKPEPSEEDSATADAPEGASEKPPTQPKDVSVTIRNGAGIAGCAKQASSVLKARAFDVRDVGNAGQFVYDKTLIVFKGDRAAAELVASVLPRGTKIVESRGMYAYDSEILVVIGKDWDVAKLPLTPVTTN